MKWVTWSNMNPCVKVCLNVPNCRGSILRVPNIPPPPHTHTLLKNKSLERTKCSQGESTYGTGKPNNDMVHSNPTPVAGGQENIYP